MNRYLVFFSESYPLIIHAYCLADVVLQHQDAIAIILIPD